MYDIMQSGHCHPVLCGYGIALCLEVRLPIYEYRCHNCGEKFEILVYSQSDTAIICPKCGSENIERVMSGFASANRDVNSATSSCAPGSRFS
jgi:putative FmdB family regulatory protein